MKRPSPPHNGCSARQFGLVVVHDDGRGYFIARSGAVEAIVGVELDLAKYADNAVDPSGGLNEWPCFADSIMGETACSAGRIAEQGQPLISTKPNTRMQPMA